MSMARCAAIIVAILILTGCSLSSHSVTFGVSRDWQNWAGERGKTDGVYGEITLNFDH